MMPIDQKSSKSVRLGLILLGLCAWTNASAQESEADLKRQIARVQQEMNTEESALNQQRSLDAQRKQVLQERVQQADQQIGELKRTQAQIRGQIQSTKNQNQGLRAAAASWENRHIVTSKEMAAIVDRISAAFAKDFPLQKQERLERLQAIRQQLAQGTLRPDEGMNRLWALMLERLRQGYQAEAWPGSFPLAQGGTAAGTYFRIGTVWQGFASEDGRELHFLTPSDTGFTWTPVPVQSVEMRSALRTAAQVASGKLPPQMVQIPVRVPQKTKGSAQ